MTSQSGFITIAILSNISQSKGKQKTKFGQLMDYDKKNVFLQNLCGK